MYYAPYLRALRVLFVHLEIFYDGLLVQQKLSIFQGLIKALETVLFLYGPKNSLKPFKRANLLTTGKLGINSIFLSFSFYLFNHQVITFPVLK